MNLKVNLQDQKKILYFFVCMCEREKEREGLNNTLDFLI